MWSSARSLQWGAREACEKAKAATSGRASVREACEGVREKIVKRQKLPQAIVYEKPAKGCARRL